MVANRTSHCWNNHTSSKNSKWLFDNLEAMDQLFNEILKLIEEDGDSLAKKADMYYQRRPKLISNVKEFYGIYCALALRYVHVAGDLAKNIPVFYQIQSQCSGNCSECSIEGASISSPSSTERTSEFKVSHFKPYWRAAGFDFFLGSGGSSDCSRKGSDESSMESGFECDYNKVMDNFENSSMLEARIVSLENEHHEKMDELQGYRKGFKEECNHLLNSESLDFSSASSSLEIRNPCGTMEADAKQFEIEILRRDHVIKEYKAWIGSMLRKNVEDKSYREIEVDAEEEKSRLEIKILEHEQTIMELKAIAAQSSSKLLLEKYGLEAKLSSLMMSINSYGAKLQDLEKKVKQLEAEKSIECAKSEKRITVLNQSLEESKLKAAKLTSEKDELKVQVTILVEDIKARDEDHTMISEQLQDMNMRHEELLEKVVEAQKSSSELTNRVKELEDEVDRQRILIMDGAEGKREVIRQLCFSIEHYRVGYQQLWKMQQVQSRRPARIMNI